MPAMPDHPLDDDQLDALRHRGDPPADRLAAALVDDHPGLDEGELVRLVLSEIQARPAPGNEAVRDWMLKGPDLPGWADRALIQRGQDFFGDWPLAITTALFCASLPGAYAAADGAQVLAVTSDLATKNITRRVAETGRMLMDVMDLGRASPATLGPGGQGYLTIRGVRLLHAVVRRTLTAEGGVVRQTCDETVPLRWCKEWGLPVNQEDLLGTLLTFTTAVFLGLDRLGIPYDPGAADAYLHTWCVVGHLLGIEPELLPIDRRQGEELMATIARRHHRSSPAGHRLTEALLAHMETSMPLGMRKLPRTLVRRLLPGEVAGLLDVPPAAWWSPALRVTARAGPLLARVPGGSALVQVPSALLGRSMIRMYVDHALAGRQATFRLDAVAAARLAIGGSRIRRTMRSRRRRIRTGGQVR